MYRYVCLLVFVFLWSCGEEEVGNEVVEKKLEVADVVGVWRFVGKEDGWDYDFREDGTCATPYGEKRDEDPFGEVEYDYYPGFSFYWYLARVDGADVIISEDPQSNGWNDIVSIEREGDRLFMTELWRDKKSGRLRPGDDGTREYVKVERE